MLFLNNSIIHLIPSSLVDGPDDRKIAAEIQKDCLQIQHPYHQHIMSQGNYTQMPLDILYYRMISSLGLFLE